MDVTKTDVETLESILDHSTLSDVLEALSIICYDKAEHIDANWQDRALAGQWRREGAKVLKASVRTLNPA